MKYIFFDAQCDRSLCYIMTSDIAQIDDHIGNALFLYDCNPTEIIFIRREGNLPEPADVIDKASMRRRVANSNMMQVSRT